MVGIWGGCSINTLCARGESRLHKHRHANIQSCHNAHCKPNDTLTADRPRMFELNCLVWQHKQAFVALYIEKLKSNWTSNVSSWCPTNNTKCIHLLSPELIRCGPFGDEAHYMFPDNQKHQTSQTQSVCNSHSDHWQQRCRSCGIVCFVIRVSRPRLGVSPTPKSLWHMTATDINGNQGTSQCVIVHFVLFTDQMRSVFKMQLERWKNGNFLLAAHLKGNLVSHNIFEDSLHCHVTAVTATLYSTNGQSDQTG